MEILKSKNRESLDLLIVILVALIFSIFSISANFMGRLYAFFNSYTAFPVAEFLVNIIFLFLAGALLITYHRWRYVTAKQSRLESILESISPDVFVVINSKRTIIMCNESVKRMFGYDVADVLGKKTDFLYFDRRSDPKQKHEIHDILERDGYHIGFATGRRKDGTTLPLEIITSNVGSNDGAVLLLRDITERRRMEKKLEALATMDMMTGVMNRRSGLEFLRRQLEIAKQHNFISSVCYCDVNDLKQINDTYGHSEGDELIKLVSRVMKKSIRKIDVICRLGGDEFLIIFPMCGKSEAARILERIVHKLDDVNDSGIKPYKMGISYGFAEYDPADGKSLNELIRIADKEMYKNKHKTHRKKVVVDSEFDTIERYRRILNILENRFEKSLTTKS